MKHAVIGVLASTALFGQVTVSGRVVGPDDRPLQDAGVAAAFLRLPNGALRGAVQQATMEAIP